MAITIVVASPQGGVGRTALVAQLASQLSAGGARCLAIDLDPHDMLSLALGGSPSEWMSSAPTYHGGLSVLNTSLGVNALTDSLRERRARVPHVPFGSRFITGREERERLSRVEALRERVLSLTPANCKILLLDTPSGDNPYSEAALSLADIALLPLRADAACLATMPAYEAYLRRVAPQIYPHGIHYVLSIFDPTRQLATDVADLLAQCVDGKVLPRAIHDDEAVREQFARGTPLSIEGGAQAFADYKWITAYVTEALGKLGVDSAAHAS